MQVGVGRDTYTQKVGLLTKTATKSFRQKRKQNKQPQQQKTIMEASFR